MSDFSLYQGGMTYRPQGARKPYLVRVAEAEAARSEADARTAAHEESAQRYEANETCPKLTSKGRQCRGLAGPSGLCPGHLKQRDAQEDAA